jgi:hypothetical protein
MKLLILLIVLEDHNFLKLSSYSFKRFRKPLAQSEKGLQKQLAGFPKATEIDNFLQISS